jgi:hypothetical protein
MIWRPPAPRPVQVLSATRELDIFSGPPEKIPAPAAAAEVLPTMAQFSTVRIEY